MTNAEQMKTTTTGRIAPSACCLAVVAGLFASVVLSASVHCTPWSGADPQHPRGYQQHTRATSLAARRAADDSRPLRRFAPLAARDGQRALSTSESQISGDQIVLGKFRAPAPERVYKQRVPSSSQLATQTVSASYRVADADVNPNEKVVHGSAGASSGSQSIQRMVGAKIMVSDEGLNYPPSKLSADIYGNVAEIVTAPPEAVDIDFLYPKSSRFNKQP